MGTIKDRNGKDLTKAEEVKKRWQESTDELYKKGLNDPDNHVGVVGHPEPVILECEVKWALGSTAAGKASGGDGIPAELLKNPKRRCYWSATLSMSANLENSAVATGLEKVSLHPSSQEELKDVQITRQLHSSPMLVRLCLKSFKPRLQHYLNWEIQDVQAGLV